MVASPTIRFAYRTAYRLMKVWWFVRRPVHRGALAAVWAGDRLLVVRHSYRDDYSLPGGGVRRRETPAEAACRELREEIGLAVEPGALVEHTVSYFDGLYIKDTAHIFEYRTEREPEVRIDNREVVEAVFLTLGEVTELRLGTHLRRYLRRLDRPPKG